jgi:hypothetical protein
MLGGAAASATGVGAIGGVPLATIGGVMSGLGMLAGALGYAEGGVATGDDSGYLEKLHGTELIVPMSGGELKKDSKGYADLMKMMGSEQLGATPKLGAMTSSLARNYVPDVVQKDKNNIDINAVALESIKANNTNLQSLMESVKSANKEMGDHSKSTMTDAFASALGIVSPAAGLFSVVAKTMLDSANTSNSMTQNIMQGVENRATTAIDFVKGTAQDVSQRLDAKVGDMLSDITSGLEDVGPKVMQAAMNPLGTAMDAISSFMAPKSKEENLSDVAMSSEGMAELAEAINSLISSSEAQLAKQDEMLRAMQDTKDYTERLYNAMS